MESERRYYEEQVSALEAAFGSAVNLSNSLAGRNVDQRLGWTTWVFARMCMFWQSIRILLSAYDDAEVHPSIDHASIAMISRSILECELMIVYLSEANISDEEWELRRLVFQVHDCSSRVRLLKGIGLRDQYKGFKYQLNALRLELRRNSQFKRLSEDAQREVVNGNRIFVNGSRQVAKSAGWSVEFWDGVYNYLSAQSHSAPMSFFRYEISGVDYTDKTAYQL